VTVSLPLPTVDNQAVTARVVSLAATAGLTALIPLPSSVYGSSPVVLTYTGTLAGVGVAVIAIPGT
jgi:hypothetical protein